MATPEIRYVLIAQHYVITPTRQASRWARSHTEVILETNSMDEAARVTEEMMLKPSVDLFCRVKDVETPGGQRGLTGTELDQFFELRKKHRKDKVHE